MQASSSPGKEDRGSSSQAGHRHGGSHAVLSQRFSTRDSLEQRQSSNDEKQREGVDSGDGEDAFLSELAATEPLRERRTLHGREEIERGDDEEKRIRRASKRKHRDSEQFLSELAAPAPVKRDDEQSGLDEDETAAKESPTVPTDHLDGSGPSPHPSSGEIDVEEQKAEPERRRSHIATHIYTVSYLIFFSILGTLARMGLQALTLYNGAPVVFSLVWPNFGGSMFIGFLVEDRNLFREQWGSPAEFPDHDAPQDTFTEAKKAHGTVKKTIPLYIGLATGFCGSFTSFSGFMRDSFLAMSNVLPAPTYHPGISPASSAIISRSGGLSFMAFLAVLITTICLSVSAVSIGAHVALFLSPITPTIPFRATRHIIDPLVVFVAFGTWLGAVFMTIFPPDRFSHHPDRWRSLVLFPIVFAPLGCLLRYYLSMHLNGIAPSFPLGTFASNIFSTMISAMGYDIQHTSIVGAGGTGSPTYHDLISCQVLQGIMDGFCGCLSTVSTWVAELKGLRTKHAYIYGFVSVAVAWAVLVIELGSVRWSIGLSAIVCKITN